jgi:hypothetical protein
MDFRKPRIEPTLGEVEYVKSNLSLLSMTEPVAKKIVSRTEMRTRTRERQQMKDQEAALLRQSLTAKSAFVQHVIATETLSKFQTEAEAAEPIRASGVIRTNMARYETARLFWFP